MNGPLLFEDRVSESMRKRSETFLVILGIVIIGAGTYLVFLIFLGALATIPALLGILVFLVVYLTKGSGQSYGPNFRIHDDCFEFVKRKRCVPWKNITRIEIFKGDAHVPSSITVIEGSQVTDTLINTSEQIPRIKDILTKKGISVTIK